MKAINSLHAQLASTSRHPELDGSAPSVAAPGGWGLRACRGLIVEISGGPTTAVLTAAFALVHEAQRLGEPVAWIGSRQGMFFPPDAVEAGVDLGALPVVFVPSELPKAQSAPRAMDHLLRSGGFGLVVADLGCGAQLSLAAQGRLAGLVRRQQATLLLLTHAANADGRCRSLGPLVTRRIEATRSSDAQGAHFTYGCVARVILDKRGTSWRHFEPCHAPPGLC